MCSSQIRSTAVTSGDYTVPRFVHCTNFSSTTGLSLCEWVYSSVLHMMLFVRGYELSGLHWHIQSKSAHLSDIVRHTCPYFSLSVCYEERKREVGGKTYPVDLCFVASALFYSGCRHSFSINKLHYYNTLPVAFSKACILKNCKLWNEYLHTIITGFNKDSLMREETRLAAFQMLRLNLWCGHSYVVLIFFHSVLFFFM